MYTEEQLIQFGYYLLSEDRSNLVKINIKGNHKKKMDALKIVYDQDIINFNFLYEKFKKENE